MTNTLPGQSERPRARVLLVDDNPLVREHLTTLLEAEKDLAVCGEAEDGPTAFTLITQRKPDLVILDISLKRSDGLELLKHLKALQPRPAVLVLTMHDEVRYAVRALEAGAAGYITKEEATANVLLAVRKVLAGQVYVSQRLAERLLQKKAGAGAGEVGSPLELLTDREWEVFLRIGRGMASHQIAQELRLGIKSVESYQARIREKLNLSDREQLRERAIQWARLREGCGAGGGEKAEGNGTGAIRPGAAGTEGPFVCARQTTLPSPRE